MYPRKIGNHQNCAHIGQTKCTQHNNHSHCNEQSPKRLAWRPTATHIFFIVQFYFSFLSLFQNLRYVWDHGYTQSLQKSLRQVVDDVVRGRTARLHRVPTVGHEASSGHALPRSRRSSAGDEMERSHRARLSRRVEDGVATHRMHMWRTGRSLVHFGMIWLDAMTSHDNHLLEITAIHADFCTIAIFLSIFFADDYFLGKAIRSSIDCLQYWI